MHKWLHGLIKNVISMSIAALIWILISLTFIDFSLFSLTPTEKYIVPGEHEIIFNELGEYYLSLEYMSKINDSIIYIEEIPYTTITSLKLNDTLEAYNTAAMSEYSYQTNDYAGMSLIKYRIDSAGIYFLNIQYKNGDTLPKFPVTFSKADKVFKILIYNFVLFASLILCSFLFVSYCYKRWNIRWGLKQSVIS